MIFPEIRNNTINEADNECSDETNRLSLIPAGRHFSQIFSLISLKNWSPRAQSSDPAGSFRSSRFVQSFLVFSANNKIVLQSTLDIRPPQGTGKKVALYPLWPYIGVFFNFD